MLLSYNFVHVHEQTIIDNEIEQSLLYKDNKLDDNDDYEILINLER